MTIQKNSQNRTDKRKFKYFLLENNFVSDYLVKFLFFTCHTQVILSQTNDDI